MVNIGSHGNNLEIDAHVIVVGGGPAGTSAAWHCARAGLNVVVLDRARFPRSKICAEYVSPEAARILHAMGALSDLSALAVPLTGMIVHTPAGGQIRGEFVAPHGFRGFRDSGMGIRREVFDTILLNRARDAGVRVMEGAKVEELTRDASGRITGVVARTHEGQHHMTCQLVIGADGLRSTVAHRMQVAHRARWPKRMAFVAHVRGVADMTSCGEMFVGDGGYVGLASVGDNITNVAVVVSARQARGAVGDADAFFSQYLRRSVLASRFTGSEQLAPVRVTGPFASRATRVWARGAMLVGDAADFFDPFTGEGIYAALRGGELLAPFAADAVHAISQHDVAAEQWALVGYDRARRDAFRGKWRVERLISSAVSSPMLMNLAGRVLGNDRQLSDLLVGVTGDFVPPSVLLSPRMLIRLTRGLFRHGVRRGPPSSS